MKENIVGPDTLLLYDRSRLVVSTILSLAVNIVFWAICLSDGLNRVWEEHFSNAQLVILFFSVLLYIAVFLLSYQCLIKRKSKKLFCENAKGAFWIYVCGLVLWGAVLLMVFQNDAKESALWGVFFWHKMSLPIMVCILIGAYIGFYYLTNRFNSFSMRDNRSGQVGFWAVAIAMTLLTGYINYVPNMFESLYHYDAYYNSVYNVVNGVPFSDGVTSIYGHYGLLIAPILKIITGLNITNLMNAFCLVTAALHMLTCFFAAYAINFFVKNRAVKYTAVIAMMISVLSLRPDIYLQAQPHRSFLLSIMLFLIALMIKHRTRQKAISIIGYIIVMLLLIWNTEMGFIAIAVWTIFMIALQLHRYGVKCKEFWVKALLCIFGGILSAAGAMSIVNLYNIAVGGTALSFSQFLYPLLTNSYIDGFLVMPLPRAVTAWVFVLGLFLVFVGYGITALGVRRSKEEGSVRSVGLGMIALLGIGGMTYFVNRAAYYNLDIIIMIAFLLLGVLIQGCLPSMKAFFSNRFKGSVGTSLAASLGVAAMFVVFVVALGCIGNLGGNMERRWTYKDKGSVTELVEQVQAEVPENTKAIGTGVAELYSFLGWDTQAYTMDFSDWLISDETKEHAKKELDHTQGEAVLLQRGDIAENAPEEFQRFMDTHELKKTFEIAGVVFEYYLPR